MRQPPEDELERAGREPARPDDLRARHRRHGLLPPLPAVASAEELTDQGSEREPERRLPLRLGQRLAAESLVEEGVETEEREGAAVDAHATHRERRAPLPGQLHDLRAGLGRGAAALLLGLGLRGGGRFRAQPVELRAQRRLRRQRDGALVEAHGQVRAAHAREVPGLADPAVGLRRQRLGAGLVAQVEEERFEAVRGAVLQPLVDLPDRKDVVPAREHHPRHEGVVRLRGVVLPLAAELAPHDFAEERPEADDGRGLAGARSPVVVLRRRTLLAPGQVDEGVDRGDRGGVELELQQRAMRGDRLLGDRGVVLSLHRASPNGHEPSTLEGRC